MSDIDTEDEPLNGKGRIEYGPLNPERALWLAVITIAIKDACGEFSGGLAIGQRPAAQAHARAWFNIECDDFCHVCHLADLDPAVTAAAAWRQIAGTPLLQLPASFAPRQRRAQALAA